MLVVLDVETKKGFSKIKENPKDLGVSFAGLLIEKNKKEEYLGFWEHELAKLWPILEKADLVVGFNILDFDFPVLKPYYPGNFNSLPTLDLLKEFEQAAGHRISLNRLAQANLNMEKNGSGLKAIDLFEQGKLEELKKYCFKDVEITYKIYKHALQFGFLKYINKWNNLRQVKLNLKELKQQPIKVQLTLGG